MGLDPLEWITIAAIGIVIYIWAPNKIPEIARSISRVRKEFDAASKELQTMSGELKNPTGLMGQEPAATSASVPSIPIPDQILIDRARKLGISTEGKTKEEISAEIFAKGSAAA